MEKYFCSICGYTYDPELGDPDSNVDVGTSWEALDESWTCPLCHVEKKQFERVE